MHKKKYQKIRDEKTKSDNVEEKYNLNDVLNPVINQNFPYSKLKYPNRLSDNQKTELLYYTPQWSYNNSNSTLQSAVENEANGYMKNYFVNDYETINQIYYNDGILKQYYILDDGLYEEYVPVENTQLFNESKNKSKPQKFKNIILSCNNKYIVNKTHDSESTSPQVGSECKSTATNEMCFFYSQERTTKDDMIEKYINQSKIPVHLESDNKFLKDESDISENFNINEYFQKINSLLKTTSNEDTTTDSLKSIDVIKLKNIAIQTDPVLIVYDVQHENHSTQTDTTRYQNRKMLKSQFLHNRSSQCDNFDIISSSHFASLKSILKYSQYVILAGVVCNMIRLSYVNKSFPFFHK